MNVEVWNSRHGHQIDIVSEERGAPLGNTEHHLYHRWVCSCGGAGHWGHALWAKLSIASARESAERHIQCARDAAEQADS